MTGVDGPRRPTVEERASRRDQLARAGSDRYSSLLHALRGGQEIELRTRRSRRLRWHPIAGTLIRAAIVVAGIYLVAVAGVRYIRDHQVDTWSGPTNQVTSGQRLDGCPQVTGYDATFPRWVRFDGHVYRATESIRPVGTVPSDRYPDTGYALGELSLLRIAGTPDGEAGRTVLLKLSSVPVGQVFEITDCD